MYNLHKVNNKFYILVENKPVFITKEQYEIASKYPNALAYDADNKTAYIKSDYMSIYYRELRTSEYDTLSDQMDEIMKWLATETEFSIPEKLKSIAMKQMAVKAKYPKPEEVTEDGTE